MSTLAASLEDTVRGCVAVAQYHARYHIGDRLVVVIRRPSGERMAMGVEVVDEDDTSVLCSDGERYDALTGRVIKEGRQLAEGWYMAVRQRTAKEVETGALMPGQVTEWSKVEAA
jgi:hypothetical protein